MNLPHTHILLGFRRWVGCPIPRSQELFKRLSMSTFVEVFSWS